MPRPNALFERIACLCGYQRFLVEKLRKSLNTRRYSSEPAQVCSSGPPEGPYSIFRLGSLTFDERARFDADLDFIYASLNSNPFANKTAIAFW